MRFTLALAAALFLSGCAVDGLDFGPSDRFQSDFHFTYPLQPNGRIDLESFNGSVEIAGWDEDKVEIAGTKYASTEATRDAIRIEIHNSASSIEIRTVRPSSHLGGMGARYTVHVPRRAMLERITTSNGPIRIHDVASAAHLKTSNGSVRIDNVAGDVEARTSNGSIDADSVHGGAILKTSNGRIRAEDVAGNCDAETSNSSIKVRLENAPSSPVRLVTSNGSVDLTMKRSPRSEVRAETRNGSITLHLPSNASARIVADTRNSSIHSDFDIPGASPRGDRGRNEHIDGVIGGGGPSIDLLTNNGQIRIVKGGGE